ncbi:MAG: hypothetical protein Fur0046_32000 [Cyanobacteria bacterium J069]
MQLTYRFASYEYNPAKPQESIAAMPGELTYRGVTVQTTVHTAAQRNHGVHSLKYRGVPYRS